MENNISNALVISGSVLIGVLLVSLAIFALRESALFAKSFEDANLGINLNAFNTKFEVYERKNNTIQDIVSCVNLSKDENEKNGVNEGDSIYITVVLDSKKIQKYDNTKLIDLMNEKNSNSFYDEKNNDLISLKFKGEVEYDENTGRVNKVVFKTVN